MLTKPKNLDIISLFKHWLLSLESYSRGRRGVPAKDVGVAMRARVQIPHSPPNMSNLNVKKPP